MLDAWLVGASGAAAFVGGLAGGVLTLVIGGLGVARQLQKSVDHQQSTIEAVADSLTREIKKRAGIAGAEARGRGQSDAETRAAAEAYLLDHPQPSRTTQRPSVVGR